MKTDSQIQKDVMEQLEKGTIFKCFGDRCCG